jgi:GNAT superfamily N-acetyltransferase
LDSFAIRPGVPGDEAAVDALLQASYPVLMSPGYDAAVLRAALPFMTRVDPRLLATGTYYLALDDGGEVVGCGGWTFDRPGSGEIVPGLAHIRHFGTHPGRTGEGIGRAIFERCLSDASRASVRRFECYASVNAENFYAALGFRRVRRMSVRMGTLAFPVILMARRL